MPWQLVSSQAGLRGAAGRKDESGRKTQGRLPGAGAPQGGGGAPRGKRSPPGSARGGSLGSLEQPYRAPQAGATGYLGAQARGALSQPPNSAARPRAPSLTGHPARTSSARSPRAPAAPRPCTPPGTVWHPRPARGCCVGRCGPSCARRHASAARKLLEARRRPAWPVTRGAGRRRGGGALLQGLPGDGGGAGYFGPAPRRRHPQLGSGRPRRAPSGGDTLANQPATWPLVPLSLFYNRLDDRWLLTPEEIATSRIHRIPFGPKSCPFFRFQL